MANPNPSVLSKQLFVITMIGAVAYIGAAFAFVIMGNSDESDVAQNTAAVTSVTTETKKASSKQTPNADARKTPKTEAKQGPKGGTP